MKIILNIVGFISSIVGIMKFLSSEKSEELKNTEKYKPNYKILTFNNNLNKNENILAILIGIFIVSLFLSQLIYEAINIYSKYIIITIVVMVLLAIVKRAKYFKQNPIYLKNSIILITIIIYILCSYTFKNTTEIMNNIYGSNYLKDVFSPFVDTIIKIGKFNFDAQILTFEQAVKISYLFKPIIDFVLILSVIKYILTFHDKESKLDYIAFLTITIFPYTFAFAIISSIQLAQTIFEITITLLP